MVTTGSSGETNLNWEWFMERLKEAIGNPIGLTFSTNFAQPVMHGVNKVFPPNIESVCTI
jgi:hypothetical protein